MGRPDVIATTCESPVVRGQNVDYARHKLAPTSMPDLSGGRLEWALHRARPAWRTLFHRHTDLGHVTGYIKMHDRIGPLDQTSLRPAFKAIGRKRKLLICQSIHRIHERLGALPHPDDAVGFLTETLN